MLAELFQLLMDQNTIFPILLHAKCVFNQALKPLLNSQTSSKITILIFKVLIKRPLRPDQHKRHLQLVNFIH
jgi:hypothetical protein